MGKTQLTQDSDCTDVRRDIRKNCEKLQSYGEYLEVVADVLPERKYEIAGKSY